MLFKASDKQVDKPVVDNVLRLYKNSKVKTPNGFVTGEALTANCSIYVNNDKGSIVLADVVSCKEDGDYVIILNENKLVYVADWVDPSAA